MHITKDNRTKLHCKTLKCLFLGYNTESKVYRLYDPNKKTIILNRDITCDENKVGYKYLNLEGLELESYLPLSKETPELPPEETTNIELFDQIEFESEDPSLQSETLPQSNTNDNISPTPTTSSTSSHKIDIQPNKSRKPSHSDPNTRQIGTRISIQKRQHPLWLQDYWTLISEINEEPISFCEANSNSGWREAIDKEKNSLAKNDTWTVVTRLQGQQPISVKWIFKAKYDTRGVITRLKARLIPRGFQQIEGIDFNEIFTPVVRWSTM